MTCEGGGIMSESVKAARQATKLEDLLSCPSHRRRCEVGVEEACKFDKDFFSPTTLSMSLLNSSDPGSEEGSGISTSFEPDLKSK